MTGIGRRKRATLHILSWFRFGWLVVCVCVRAAYASTYSTVHVRTIIVADLYCFVTVYRCYLLGSTTWLACTFETSISRGFHVRAQCRCNVPRTNAPWCYSRTRIPGWLTWDELLCIFMVYRTVSGLPQTACATARQLHVQLYVLYTN